MAPPQRADHSATHETGRGIVLIADLHDRLDLDGDVEGKGVGADRTPDGLRRWITTALTIPGGDTEGARPRGRVDDAKPQ